MSILPRTQVDQETGEECRVREKVGPEIRDLGNSKASMIFICAEREKRKMKCFSNKINQGLFAIVSNFKKVAASRPFLYKSYFK